MDLTTVLRLPRVLVWLFRPDGFSSQFDSSVDMSYPMFRKKSPGMYKVFISGQSVWKFFVWNLGKDLFSMVAPVEWGTAPLPDIAPFFIGTLKPLHHVKVTSKGGTY